LLIFLVINASILSYFEFLKID